MNCLFCLKPLGKGQSKFCCPEHFQEYRKSILINNWLEGKDEGWSGTGTKKFIRNYMLEKANYKCELCGWGERNPYSNLIPLELHHKDGNYRNNKIDNLQILCPNCHSLTDTYKSMNKDSTRDREGYINRKKLDINNKEKISSKEQNHCIDCGKEISAYAIRCRDCESKNRAIPLNKMPVTREELKTLIRTTSFLKIGKRFNVSDNTIRKWCDKFNLPRRVSDIKSYSDEEWELI